MSRSERRKTGVWKRSARSKACHRELEALPGTGRIEADVLGVAVRGVGGQQQVALLRARGHPGGRPRALHVHEDGGHLGVVRQADELAHQVDARAGRGREGPRAHPAGADHHPRGGQLVLRLDDAVVVLPGLGIHAEALAALLEAVHDRGGGRDGVPRPHRGARVHASERRGGVAGHHDVVPGGVHALHADGERAVPVLPGVVGAHADRGEVGVDEARLVAELLLEHPLHHVHLDVEERHQRADVADVLHQDPLAGALEALGAHARQGDPEEGDVVAQDLVVEVLGGVVEHPAPRHHLVDVPLVALRVHRHHQVEVGAAGGVAVPVHPDLVPGGEPLDVGREDVLPGHGDPHAEQRLQEQAVRAGGARAVYRADLQREVVEAVACVVGQDVVPA